MPSNTPLNAFLALLLNVPFCVVIGKPRDQRATLSRDRCNPRHDGVGSSSSSNSGSGDETKDSTGNDRPDKTRQLIQDAADKEAKKANLGDEFYTREKLPEERINKLMSLQDFVSLELLMVSVSSSSLLYLFLS